MKLSETVSGKVYLWTYVQYTIIDQWLKIGISQEPLVKAFHIEFKENLPRFWALVLGHRLINRRTRTPHNVIFNFVKNALKSVTYLRS
jgi:hypothetical protein